MDAVKDLSSSLLYYDRKEDEELGKGEIEEAVASGEVTIDEMADCFKANLVQGLE